MRGFFVRLVECLEESVDALEVAIYDVQMVDFVAAQEEGESDMPVGLLACTKYNDVVDVVALLEEHGAGEGSAEGGDLFGVDQSSGVATLVEECEAAFGGRALSACERLRWCEGGRWRGGSEGGCLRYRK